MQVGSAHSWKASFLERVSHPRPFRHLLVLVANFELDYEQSSYSALRHPFGDLQTADKLTQRTSIATDMGSILRTSQVADQAVCRQLRQVEGSMRADSFKSTAD